MPEIKIKAEAGGGGEFMAYLAKPQDAGRYPAIIVVQEIFGVNANLRAICDSWAQQGYVAVCPDLFWRQEPGVQLTDKSKAEWDKAFQLYQGFDVALGIKDLEATLKAMRAHPACNGQVGAVGFCLGGKLAYLLATDTDIDASVGYYGVGIQDDLARAATIRKPLLLHIAGRDKFVPPEAQQKIRIALGPLPLVTLYSYDEQDHAFTRVGGEHYDAKAAELAHNRTREFFARNLKK